MANGVVSNGQGLCPSPDDSTSSVHALLIPYPLQGHIIPAVQLALRLASRGITVTFVNTEAVHHQTRKAAGGMASSDKDDDIFSAARLSGLDIRYELVNDGLPVEFDRSLHHDEFMESLLHNLPSHIEDLVGRVAARGGSPAVTCLIADTFFVWPATISRRLSLAHVSFWTEPALVFNLYYHIHLLRENRHFGCKDKREDVIDYIPGVPSIHPGDLMSYLQDDDTNTVVHRIIYKAFKEAKEADFVLCNTVHELEPSTIAALKSEKPFYPIGPIFRQAPSISSSAAAPAVPTSMWAECDCTQWLASRPSGSVLYISFGSYAHMKKHVLHEIAMGILGSGVGFLWVLRPDIVSSDEPNPLPDEFLEGTRDRGLVVTWCQQRQVLAHPAVGGFLTHCGWNSILESVWAGVPMLCFPLLTDQFTNRSLVVGDWMIGMDVAGEGGMVERKEVAGRVRQVIEGEEGKSLRKEVGVVRRKLEDALGAHGSSQQNFDRFVQDLIDHVNNKNGHCQNKSS